MQKPTVEFMAPDGKRSEVDFCDRNLNLLAHAQAIELEIGSRCGGHGICGGDRVRIDIDSHGSNLSPLTEREREHLSSEEIAQGWRLACQCYPETSEQSILIITRIIAP